MTLNQKIIAALSGFGNPVVPKLYTGKERVYYTFNYTLRPFQFADNYPVWYKALVQVHFFCPLTFDSVARQTETAQALTGAGFTWPEVIDVSDKEIQHLVFECETIAERMES